ncbi:MULTISPECIES: hypothetical protein [Streptomyces]|nr:hypothetical protein [Streptomyces sp. 7G]MCA1270453.1 hypothetical protein [Streptomyces sp. 7G]GHE72148.1 hypothetical protein GCM10018782_52320 [Streptomyces griseoaurantiacus]
MARAGDGAEQRFLRQLTEASEEQALQFDELGREVLGVDLARSADASGS